MKILSRAVLVASFVVVATSASAQSPAWLGESAEGQGAATEGTPWTSLVKTTTVVNFPVTAVGGSSDMPCYIICWPPNCTGSGTVTLNEALAAPFSVVNLRRHTGPIVTGADCTGTPVSFPVTLGSNQELVMDFRFSPTSPGSFADTMNASGLLYNLSGSTPGGGSSCVPDATTLCIDNRFRVRINYATTQGGGLSGTGKAIALTSLGVTHGGLFWFFGADNPEMLIKVLDGCAINNRKWIYFSAGTNVGFTVTVTDMVTSQVKTYINPDLHPADPLQDTSALPCS